MSKSSFIEDIFLNFVNVVISTPSSISNQELTAACSFQNLLINDKPLTQNQANLIMKLLNKYKLFMISHGFDYSEFLKTPQWKHPFRVLDMSKKIYVEKDSDGELWACLKFPFALKDIFDKEMTPVIKDFSNSRWDADKKVRVIKLYDYNLIELANFAEKHNFEIDETFLEVLSNVEQIWQNQDHIIPYSVMIDDRVHIVNSSSDTDEFWNTHSTDNQHANLLLAKSMGYPFRPEKKEISKIETIAASPNSHFWIKEIPEFFEIQKLISGNTVIILNKGDSHIDWVKLFVSHADNAEIPRTDIRVCFRLDKNEDNGFNQWVKDQGIGGKVDGGKIFIFQNKPAKWLFSDNTNVTIIATNSLYPVPSSITQSWMNSHPFVCYLGPIKAANARERKIVEL